MAFSGRCLHCLLGSVKKVTVFKIVHDKYSSKGRPKSVKSCDDFLHSFDFAKGEIPSIEHFISSAKVPCCIYVHIQYYISLYIFIYIYFFTTQ